MIIDIEGDIFYLNDGLLDRKDGPAIEYSNGDKYWFDEGFLHRDNGPAVMNNNGIKEYWLFGRLAQSEEIQNIKRNKWLEKFLNK